MSRLSNPANAEALQGSMTSGANSIKLPFAAVTLWWNNGSVQLEGMDEIKDARRFGGWGISKEDVDDQRAQLPQELPGNWRLFEGLTNGEGGKYSAYLTRSAYVAPIDRRFSWRERSQVEILGYLATRTEDKKLLPWGPVILSAKGYASKDLDNCITEFKKASTNARGDDPINLFYIPLGTFGDAPKFEKRVSKKPGSPTSSVTPCQLYKPKDGITAAGLDEWFVGDEIAAEMGLLRAQAQEWLHAFDKDKKAQGTGVNVPEPIPPEDDGFPY